MGGGGGGWRRRKVPAAQKSKTINDNEMKFGGIVENHKHIKGRTIRSPGKGVGSYQKKKSCKPYQ